MVYFGPSGNPPMFYDAGGKHSKEVPSFLKSVGLSAYEYQCSKGCKIKEETAAAIGAAAKENSVLLSIHGPYYVNLSSLEGEKRENCIRYMLEALRVANIMQADRVVIHSGGCNKMPREDALALAMQTLSEAIKAADAEHLGHIHLCPETMGKINQLGTLDEVIRLCLLDERLVPTIDFGHLNARSFGGVKTKEDYAFILDEIYNKLGSERGKSFHAHFSKIEYTENGGEKQHLTFDDTVFGPDFEPLALLLAERDISPRIICESNGTMAEDALLMKKMYENALLLKKD